MGGGESRRTPGDSTRIGAEGIALQHHGRRQRDTAVRRRGAPVPVRARRRRVRPPRSLRVRCESCERRLESRRERPGPLASPGPRRAANPNQPTRIEFSTICTRGTGTSHRPNGPRAARAPGGSSAGRRLSTRAVVAAVQSSIFQPAPSVRARSSARLIWYSRKWSARTRAAIDSSTGMARGTIHGSWRPVLDISPTVLAGLK